MDECFRFLINVDQCLNMSTFDIFFYKLINERKFRLNQVQLQGNVQETFRPAFQDIQMYLNKYPYHMEEYQLIIAMRGPLQQENVQWENTMLCRLMRIGYDLHCEHLCQEVERKAGRALSLFMLYESDPHLQKPELTEYLNGEKPEDRKRLESDCAILLNRMGIQSTGELSQQDGALALYQQQPNYDRAAVFFVGRFLEARRNSGAAHGNLHQAFAQFLAEQFINYQVVEMVLPRDVQYAPRENMLARLRIVEFINRSVKQTACPKKALIIRCRENWQAVEKTEDLEQCYGDMLFVYEQALRSVHQQLEKDTIPVARNENTLPKKFHECLDDISIPKSIFEKKDAEEPGFIKRLDMFLASKTVSGDGEGSWNDTYRALEELLQGLEGELEQYVDGLSRQYAQRVEKRKKEALYWKSQLFFADRNTEGKIAQFAERRDQCLQQLREPDTTPSLRFEDQQKVEDALKQANAQITHNIDCLNANSKANFAAVFLTVLLATVAHYTLLQPFVYGDIVSLPVFVIYIGLIALGLGLTCFLPTVCYRRAIKKRVLKLKEEINLHVPSYFGRAAQFRQYINTLDELDNAVKLLDVYQQSLEATQDIQRGCMWHKAQLKDHLVKVSAFRSLIDCGAGRSRSRTFAPEACSTKELLNADGTLKSIEQCSLYWPQGRGD